MSGAGFVDSGSNGYFDEVAEACEEFQLGDLIAEPPFVIGRSDAEEVATGSPGKVAEVKALVSGGQPPYAILTSQTCDIRDPERLQPWIFGCPVYRYEDIEAVPRRTFIYQLGELPDLGEGMWVVDFRVWMSIEKSVLVGRTPIRVLSTEDEKVFFAETVGRRFDRAALATVVNDVLYGEMKRKIRNNKKRAKAAFGQLHLVGLAIEQGDRLEPIAVQLHFVTKSGSLDDDAREWLDAYWDGASVGAKEHDPPLELHANDYHDGSAMDVVVLDDLIPLQWNPWS